MIWLTRVVPAGEEHFIRELFLSQREALGYPRHMMLIGLLQENATRHLYVCLPDLDLLPSYYGFSRVAKAGLPRAPFFLEGERSAFEDVFQS